MTISPSNGNIPILSQPSVRLSIPESLPEIQSKNNAFFNIPTTTYSIRPPPPPMIQLKTYNQEHIPIEHHDSYPTFTDRIRCLVLANRKSSVVAPEKIEEKTIIPFPAPTQRLLTPQDGSAIPVISLSPNYSTNKTNIIPLLSEAPMLGDDDENLEYKFLMAPPVEDNLIGKYVWKYRIIHSLGEGAFSKFLDHDRIVQLEATMETEQHLCIVLEYVQGEELFDFVQHMHSDIHEEATKASIDEQLIKRLTLELVQVVSWLHNHNIVHRDLKLENILVYYDNRGELHLKLTDFGLARVFDPKQPILTTRCGSEEYTSPEIIQSIGYDGRLTDTWSIGIILYALLVGYLPFSYSSRRGERVSHLYHRIVLAKVNWPHTDKISEEAKEVVQRILVREPDKRIRLDQLDALLWFQ
ncbi:kinase-like domain-containing protein [Mucor mucedo]|uniref:kinase-like domain-containing protein n=1 Tax=Mucor mucedo TaxID=29922 RepID=UPI00221ED1E1|nr:kinase-like domain-containing protein [Mucor mucedo]KAI7895031.1 kinase-like domain-containing protein [Mucor mucedo]